MPGKVYYNAELHVLEAVSRGVALLLVGLDFESQETLGGVPRLRDITALLLADGGAAGLNPPEWIEKLHPQVVLLSAAAEELAPDPDVQAAMQGYTLLRTDHNGWIELTTDGEQIWLEVERR